MSNTTAFASVNYMIENLSYYKIRDITNLKLQKLLYFAYGVHLSLYDTKLFDDPIQAWKLGPVIPSVYQEFKDYQDRPLSPETRAVILKNDYSGYIEIPRVDENNEPQTKAYLSPVQRMAIKKAWELVDITHGENSAWKKAYSEHTRGAIILDSDIKFEFEGYMDTLAGYLLG